MKREGGVIILLELSLEELKTSIFELKSLAEANREEAWLQRSRTLEKTEDKHQPLREGVLSVKQNDGILKPSAYFLEKTD